MILYYIVLFYLKINAKQIGIFHACNSLLTLFVCHMTPHGFLSHLQLYIICNTRLFSHPLTGSCSFWQTRSASLQQPLRKLRWTRCSSSPESQSAEWLMGMAGRVSACSTPATLGSRRIEYTHTQTQV